MHIATVALAPSATASAAATAPTSTPPITAAPVPAASSPTIVAGRRIDLADGLNAEWRRHCADPGALARARSWPLGTPAFHHLDELLWHAGYGRPTVDDAGDRVLARLVGQAAQDEFAARVVLQRILPGLIRIALRRGRIVDGGPVAAFDDLATAAWLTIRTFPVGRRPRCVAANLLRDIEYQAFVRDARRRQASEQHVGDLERACGELPLPEVEPDPSDEWDELVTWARGGGLDAGQIDLLVRCARGQSTIEIARAYSCTDRTVRNRREAALSALRRAYARAAA